MAAILAVLASLCKITVNEVKAWGRWARQMVLIAARNLRAFLVWLGTFAAARIALAAAAVACFEVFTVYVSTRVITPLAGGFIRTCIPPGSAGDGIVWMLWDTGLNGKAIFSAFVVYIANYTALWYALDTWLRAQAISLATYRANVKRAKAIRDTSLLS